MRANQLFRVLFAGAASLTLSLGCVGEPPGDPDDVNDPLDPPEVALQLSGTVMDYFILDPLPNATVETDGLTVKRTATSGVDGAFSLEVDVGSVFFTTAVLPNYRVTKSEPIAVLEANVNNDVYVMSSPDVDRQYATVGVIMVPETSFMAIDLRDNLGNPLVGVAPEQIQLLNVGVEPPAPVGNGPFFFNDLGDIAPLGEVPTSIDVPGRGARAAFLNVPVANLELVVTVDIGGQLETFTVPVAALPDGALMVRTGAIGGPADLPPPQGRITFVKDVYPMLQRAAQGGLACANCHTAEGTYPDLQFDLPAEEVYALGELVPGLFIADPDPAVAMQSMILTKPLLEDPPDHPNATFLSTEDPRYQLWLQWLVEGAILQ